METAADEKPPAASEAVEETVPVVVAVDKEAKMMGLSLF